MERFEFSSPIGTGSHAEVIQAFDHQLGRTVAIKLSFDPKSVERMTQEERDAAGIDEQVLQVAAMIAKANSRYTPLREARMLALVDHPNVISVLDIGLIDNHMLAVLLPYLDGGTLAARKFTGSWEATLDVALQIGWGLAALHDAGILHRDLKPTNILFDHEGRPRIADLGLACMVNETEALRERVGTAAYMAPDVVTRGFQDMRDDVYAYCMIVYEMFEGHSPFMSTADREHGRVARPHLLKMPREVHRLLERGLAADADARWPTIKPLLRQLERVRRAPKRWPWAVAAAGLVMSFAAGSLVDERTAEADACSDIMDELGPVWNEGVQGELLGAFGSRKAGDGMMAWANQWLVVRARECGIAREQSLPLEPSPCMVSVLERFNTTLHAFRTPHLRDGLRFASVIAELPAPEHCIDHPGDADWGYGGLLELRNIDVDVDAIVRLGDLELARERQLAYMDLALELNSTYGTARALYFEAELHRLEGRLEEATKDFEAALRDAVSLEAHLFQAEALLKLTAVSADRGQLDAVNAYALIATQLFAHYQPDRVAELLQVQGLALVNGDEHDRAEGVGLLLRAVELREEQFDRYGRTRELLSQAHESYAKGLVNVGRAAEAIEYLDLALYVHQEEFGHGTWRTRGILREKFSALLTLGQFEEAESTWWAILKDGADKAAWSRYVDDALWIALEFQQVGQTGRAAFVLRLGRNRAVEHRLNEKVTRIDLALEQLDRG